MPHGAGPPRGGRGRPEPGRARGGWAHDRGRFHHADPRGSQHHGHMHDDRREGRSDAPVAGLGGNHLSNTTWIPFGDHPLILERCRED